MGDGGRSGSFFFFTQNSEFIVKTISPKEKERLLSLLPALVEHYQENRESYIEKILGLYSIKLPGIWEFDVILQRNAIRIKPENQLLALFDLKGSTYKR